MLHSILPQPSRNRQFHAGENALSCFQTVAQWFSGWEQLGGLPEAQQETNTGNIRDLFLCLQCRVIAYNERLIRRRIRLPLEE